ncbi:hypothetical protein BXY85_1900 [Roseivirga pacifica]|uniref:Uncharacterized protein n=1 Tax=Roseivirga pacifica TaxID=1267423 RepID=A0A1I0N2V2_9BACT|nr:hypothetical protein [Roseivirga pacifica]RKQ50880.1 hypothetical protein BXY85_1900 [Roseivirga pacifica]SEV95219.1 hypothetical protein SAMN05216290_0882 [Roseivirga pacifica]
MNCIINDTIARYWKKGINPDVLARYIAIKHRISVDKSTIFRRIEAMNLNF